MHPARIKTPAELLDQYIITAYKALMAALRAEGCAVALEDQANGLRDALLEAMPAGFDLKPVDLAITLAAQFHAIDIVQNQIGSDSHRYLLAAELAQIWNGARCVLKNAINERAGAVDKELKI